MCQVYNILAKRSKTLILQKRITFETGISSIYKIKKRVVKEVFGHVKRKLFNAYMNHLLY